MEILKLVSRASKRSRARLAAALALTLLPAAAAGVMGLALLDKINKMSPDYLDAQREQRESGCPRSLQVSKLKPFGVEGKKPRKAAPATGEHIHLCLGEPPARRAGR